MKISELDKKDKKELDKILLEKKEKLARLRFDLSLKKVKNTAEIKEVKKDIARLFTLIKKTLN